jgi:hypothetical protein
MPPEDAVVANVKVGYFERKYLLMLLFPVSQDTSWSMSLIRVNDCPGIILWKVSCTGVSSAKLRPVSMNVFLIMRIREVPLSINVLATLYCLIGIFTTEGKFLSDSSVSGWSSGPNEMLTSDNFIILPGSMR